MPCHTRMKTIFQQGFIWLCLIHFSFVASIIEPGYLDFDNLPDTNFSCVGKVIGGYYADLETSCQMFHVCTIGQLDEPMDIRFLCLNGTVFDQETRVCERVDEVDCSKSERFYHLNLELYGNTAPPIVEELDETELPIISTTTQRTTSTLRTTRATFFTTIKPTPPTTHNTPKVITSNQFPINSGPDIRFNPEEINIRLTPGSPPIIKSPSVSFQQQSFNNGNSRITVTTHLSNFKEDRTSPTSVITSSTQKPKSVVSYGLQHTNPSYQSHRNYEYNYQQQTENSHSDVDYHTDLPSEEYSDLGYDDPMHFESSHNKKQEQVYSASTTKRVENKPTEFSRPLISQQQGYTHNYHRTDKPPKLQLSHPLFPTLPPLIFSSPAPFTLARHFETKRSNDNYQRPRIIVSASASVSDASGRRLNYSLGTIGASHILAKPPHSYDDYKEDDVVLDPFYHDVPKVNNKSRRKRDLSTERSNSSIITSTEINNYATHWTPPDYVDDNYEPLVYHNDSKNYSALEINTLLTKNVSNDGHLEYYDDYVDDNYEPFLHNKLDNNSTTISSTEVTTELSSETTTQEVTLEANTFSEKLNTSSNEIKFSNENTNFETTTNLNLYLEDIDASTIETTTIVTTTEPNSLTSTTTELFPETTTEMTSTTNSALLDEETTTTVATTVLPTREPSHNRLLKSYHRFSSPHLLKFSKHKAIDSSTSSLSSDEIKSEVINYRLNRIISQTTTTRSYNEVIKTEAPLSKSANPTESKSKKALSSTTPITKINFGSKRFSYGVTKSFNCIGRELNKFYEDPRDCRLFHYCTPGYSETQVLDMKFVCDLGTYFDSDKLICAKAKPQRCTI